MDKHLVPDSVHPNRSERKINDRQKDFDAVEICLAPDFSWNDITKDENGKPFLGSQFLGISHSNEMVVVCWSEENFGLDIQYVEEKIAKTSMEVNMPAKYIKMDDTFFLKNKDGKTL
jgi:phosphopantetheinyl transferase